MTQPLHIKGLVLGIAVAMQVLLPLGAVEANPTAMHGTANFMTAITLTPSSLDFGKITFGNAPAAGDSVVLSPSGGVTYKGTFAAAGTGTVSAGDVAISGSNGNVVTVTCDASGVLAQTSGTGRITVDSIKIADSANASSGGGACQGVNGAPALTFTLTAGDDDHLKLGGTIDGATQVSFGAGVYSSANSGGAAINVTVNYQ